MLTILYLFAGCKQKELNCSKFTSGNFLYQLRLGNDDFHYQIIRKGDIQWEINQKTSDTSTFLVKWTGACSYDLYFQKNSNDSINLQRQQIKQLPVKTDILTVTDNYYIFKAQQADLAFALTDTLWINK